MRCRFELEIPDNKNHLCCDKCHGWECPHRCGFYNNIPKENHCTYGCSWILKNEKENYGNFKSKN